MMLFEGINRYIPVVIGAFSFLTLINVFELLLRLVGLKDDSSEEIAEGRTLISNRESLCVWVFFYVPCRGIRCACAPCAVSCVRRGSASEDRRPWEVARTHSRGSRGLSSSWWRSCAGTRALEQDEQQQRHCVVP